MGPAWGRSATRLAPATINRVFAAVSSFYEYLILAGDSRAENPIQQRPDPALARVSDRHQPFMGLASRQRPVRRVVRVRTIQRLPRPLDEEQVAVLLGSLKRWRDRAMVLLMLHGLHSNRTPDRTLATGRSHKWPMPFRNTRQ